MPSKVVTHLYMHSCWILVIPIFICKWYSGNLRCMSDVIENYFFKVKLKYFYNFWKKIFVDPLCVCIVVRINRSMAWHWGNQMTLVGKCTWTIYAENKISVGYTTCWYIFNAGHMSFKAKAWAIVCGCKRSLVLSTVNKCLIRIIISAPWAKGSLLWCEG